MTNLLIKLFIRDKGDKITPELRKKYGTFSSIVGVTVNVLLSILKLVIGLLTVSSAIIADALNNLSDAGASVISMISFKLSAKPADRDHPFGHARIEYVASMIVSFLILLVGFEFLIDAAKSLFGMNEPSKTSFSTVSLIILGASIIGKLWLALFYRKIAKKIDSSVIKASSLDSLGDCISTSAVLISAIIIKLTDIQIIDTIVGMGVSVMIIIAGAKILNETKNSILGEAPVSETVEQIKSIVSEDEKVLGIHDLIVHNYGPGRYIASLHAEVNGKEDIYMLHDRIDNLEKRIESEMNILCTIHLDPIVTDDEAVNELKAFATEVVSDIDASIHLHDFRAVIGETHTNLIFDIEVPFEIKLAPEEIKNLISLKIKEKRPDCFCVITVDRC